MTTPFPTDPAERKAVHAAMVAAAPDLMGDVAAWRQMFPKAKLAHFKAPALELGEATPDGWHISDALVYRVERPAIQAAIEAEQRKPRRPAARSRKR